MTKNWMLVVLILGFAGLVGRAQGLSAPANWLGLEQQQNPAWVARSDGLRLGFSGEYRQTHLLHTSSLRTAVLSAEQPLRLANRTHLMGIVLTSEMAGDKSNNYLTVQYAIEKPFGKGSFRAGAEVGFANIRFDAERLRQRSGDTLLTANSTSAQLDVGLGIAWANRYFQVGISGKHLTAPNVKTDGDSTFRVPRTLHLFAESSIRLPNSSFEVRPSAFITLKSSDFQSAFRLQTVYGHRFQAGVLWHSQDGWGGLVGVVLKGFDVGYAFSRGQAGRAWLKNGTHWLCVVYHLSSGTKATKRPVKSVRFL